MAYDNTNRGSLWATRGAHGPVDVEGDGLRGFLIATPGQKEKVPVAMLFLRRGQENMSLTIPLWMAQENTFGQVYRGDTPTHFVNVYKPESPSERAPALNVQFKPKDAKPPAQAAPQAGYEPEPDEDDIPF